jgi:ubiquinone/menaquinone biosynthesis C-methylase UbiE
MSKHAKVRKGPMPKSRFALMALLFKLRDLFLPVDEFVLGLGIQPGFTIIDYGCGPGSYLNKTSELVDKHGKVYAVDIHELAIKAVKNRINKYGLTNVEPVLAAGYSCLLNDQIADMIMALDMFHMIDDPTRFLKELHRLINRKGYLVINHDHMSRDEARRKIINSTVWEIASEHEKYLQCNPI